MFRDFEIVNFFLSVSQTQNSRFILTDQQYGFAIKELSELVALTNLDTVKEVITFATHTKKWAYQIGTARNLVDLWNKITYSMQHPYDPNDHEKEDKRLAEERAERAKEETQKYIQETYGKVDKPPKA